MSHPDPLYKRFLIDVSLEHVNIINREDFWLIGVRVREFKGNGRYWEDTEIVET